MTMPAQPQGSPHSAVAVVWATPDAESPQKPLEGPPEAAGEGWQSVLLEGPNESGLYFGKVPISEEFEYRVDWDAAGRPWARFRPAPDTKRAVSMARALIRGIWSR